MLLELSVLPMGKTHNLSEDVAKVVDIIDHSGCNYQLTSMGTLIEGDWGQVMGVVGRCRDELLKSNERLYMVLKVDEDKSHTLGEIESKVASVEEKLHHKVKH